MNLNVKAHCPIVYEETSVSLRNSISQELLADFTQLIAEQTGLAVREQDRAALSRKILTRMNRLGISSASFYYRLLALGAAQNTPEWQAFVLLLTNIESYFFRDRGQFQLLEQQIFPDLIERAADRKTLRIWSAGCSTGEEPYSLAMVLSELLGDRANWTVTILGTDINEDALQRARCGCYTPWSFRTTDEIFKQKYFTPTRNQYQISETLRSQVQFRYLNLFKDSFFGTQPNLEKFDLILCRNVFIYFESAAIAKTLEKFYNSLNPLGYLITGHAELYNQNTSQFQTKIFPESVVYQRPPLQNNPRPVELPPALPQSPLRRLKTPSPKAILANREIDPTISLLAEAHGLFTTKNYQMALHKAQQVLHLQPQHLDASYLIAQIQANAGQYEQAVQSCQAILSLDPFSVKTYTLLAQIAEEVGDREGTKNFLKKIIYLQPQSLSAYWELSYIYELEGNWQKAKKMYEATIAILETLPASQKVENCGELTVGDLKVKIKQKLNNFA
jgi:chemotaxis protein methyltransferase CheR